MNGQNLTQLTAGRLESDKTDHEPVGDIVRRVASVFCNAQLNFLEERKGGIRKDFT